MKIAFFTDTYHPSVDGVVRSIDNFSAQLRKEGHQVMVFAPEGAAGFERMEHAVYAPSVSFPSYPQYRIPVFTGSCIKECKKFKPDVIHSHAMAAMALVALDASKKCGAPIVGTFHTLIPKAMHYISPNPAVQEWGQELTWRYISWLYSKFDLTIAPSRFMAGELEAHGISSKVLSTPIDVKKFSPGKVESGARKYMSAGSKTILFVGRIAKEKNIEFILQMAKTKKWEALGLKLVIAGDGPYKKEVEKKVKEFGLEENVKFVGRIEERLLPSFYRAAIACVFPSKFETQGLTALESMACGTPVLALKNTALSEVVKEGRSGSVCEEDVGEAMESLEKIIRNRKKLSVGARKIALEYTLEKCTHRLEEFYKTEIDKG